MQKWKCSAVIFIIVNVLFTLCFIDDYYEVFIKDCRDMFPFNYCPWGAESLGYAWSAADVYWISSIMCLVLFCVFLFGAVYAYCCKRYSWALYLSMAPWVILIIRSLVR